MSTIHMTMQGKGGVGKSMIASFVTQYLLDKGLLVLPIDTDPVNASLAAYESFGTREIELLAGNTLNHAAFDNVVEMVLGHEGPVVVDNGASSFIPLGTYLMENPAVAMFEESGRSVVIHSVITGGPAFGETLAGFAQVAASMPASVKIIVWLNEYFGPIRDEDGKEFEAFPLYKKLKDRVAGIVRLEKRTDDTFGRDLREMLERHMTFAEASKDAKAFKIMQRQRLAMIQRDIYAKLDAVL